MAGTVKVISISIGFMMTISSLWAQEFYVTTGNGIHKVTLGQNCNATITTAICIDTTLSIAIFNDNIYYNKNTSLYKATLQNDAYINCKVIDDIPGITTSLTVDTVGQLYFAQGRLLFKKNPDLPGHSFLGEMPYLSAGDLVFYKNQLYMASTEGILHVNTVSPELSKLIIPISNSSMYGLATVALDCNVNRVIGMIRDGHSTNLVEIDIEKREISKQLCKLPFVVFDAGSSVENGQKASIKLNEIIVAADCINRGKATLQIVTEKNLPQFTYLINNSMRNTNGIFQNLSAGIYNIKITSPGGCEKDTVVLVPQFDISNVRLVAHLKQPTCTAPGQIWFSANELINTIKIKYERDTFSANHVFENLKSGEHKFFATDPNCIIDSFTVSLSDAGYCDTIYFPNAFSPNGDGKNDTFKGSQNYAITGYRLIIFNRWGQKIFSTTDQRKGWDGSLNSVPNSAGTYVYSSSYINATGILKYQKGTIVLLR
jgi:gliding motility-associated-like protein